MTDSDSNNDKKAGKLWGGRFTEATDAFVERFTASVQFDKRLYQCDIDGSIAHAKMLGKTGVLSAAEQEQIVTGLEAIRTAISEDRFDWSVALEDVHMNIEAALTARIGDVGKKLHTGRSRNDQVATDIRLFVRGEIDHIMELITRLQNALVDLAEREADTIMPGFTHLQTAQPVTFGHHMLAWYEMLERDYGRLVDCRKRVNVSPLGAAALAGTTFPIDRDYTAQLLGFDRPSANSLDSVSDRDFAIELAACASLLMTHLSRFSEELVLWTSAQFEFIDLPDRFCTGSSIMPQKKNPDVPELVRGKTGRVTGHLVSLLTLMKSQPLAYNKDNQEDKEPLFDLINTVKDCLYAYSEMMAAVTCRAENMRRATLRGYATATDLADYLVQKGLPFRDAHEVVGKAVAHAIEQGKDLSELPLETLRQFSAAIDKDVFKVLELEGSVNARDHLGGTAPKQVRAAVATARESLARRQS
ncbi:MAG: argininosuccinate lyase [Pseudohongiellaceae bacterium]